MLGLSATPPHVAASIRDRDICQTLRIMSSMSPTPRLLTPAEVARALGVSPRHVNRIRDLEPAYRVPGRTGARLYHPDDVARLARARGRDIEAER